MVNEIRIPSFGADVEIIEIDTLNRRVICKLSFARKRSKRSTTHYDITLAISLKNSGPLIEKYISGQNTIINAIMDAGSSYEELQEREVTKQAYYNQRRR